MENNTLEKKLKDGGILWKHNGDPKKPHALLTSGLHADTFNNGSKLVENPRMVSEIAFRIIEKLMKHKNYQAPDWVMGPAFGAITLGHEIAHGLNKKFAFTEPVQIKGKKTQVLKRFEIKAGEKVLVIEDAISTGSSILKTIEVLENIGVEIIPCIASVVNWSGSRKLKDRHIISLFSAQPKIWTPELCPLCKGGSKVLRPKVNWEKFIEN